MGRTADADVFIEPRFTPLLFRVDAVSLEGEERKTLIEALTAVARNFPGDEVIDHPVREKALAIALRLDSMDAAARETNDALIAGTPLPPSETFRERGLIGELLWELATRLRREKLEPADPRLGLLLMEIVMHIDPEHAADRQQVYRGAVPKDRDAPNWNNVVTARPPKTAAIPARPRPPAREPAESVVPPAAPGKPGREAVTEGGAGKRTPPVPKGPDIRFGRDTGTVHVVLDKAGGRRGSSAPNVYRLTAEVVDVEGPRKAGQSPIYSEEGIGGSMAASLAPALALLQERYQAFPQSARVKFTLESVLDGSRESLRHDDLVAPMFVLMDSLLSGTELDADFVLSGTIGENGGFFSPVHSAQWVRVSGEAGLSSVIAGRSAETELKDALLAGESELLYRVQVFQVVSANDIVPILMKERFEEVNEAMRSFGEVRDLLDKYSPEDLARNSAVQARLEEILDKTGAHLSAKLLLAFGRGELPDSLSLPGSVGRVDFFLAPVLHRAEETANVVTTGSVGSMFGDSVSALRTVRPKLHPEARTYCDATVDFMLALEKYLVLGNRSSGIAMQAANELEQARLRVRQVSEQFDGLMQERPGETKAAGASGDE